MDIEARVLGEPRPPAPATSSGTASGGAATAAAPPRVAPAARIPHPGPEALRDCYLDWLRAALPAGSTFAGRRVLLDCANGAASDLAPRLFRALGADVQAINDAPDGRNINEGCGALHPERLASEVTRRGAWLGLAFDGDADRCLPVDARGRILDGDYVLCLAARDLHARGRLSGDTVVGTVMSNLWLERALHGDGIRLTRAPVGDKYVLEEMQRGGSVLGGEQSGHIIFLERATTGDGLLTGVMLMDLLHRNAIDLAAWASTITPCPQILINVPVRSRPPLDAHPVIGAAIRSEAERLHGSGRVLVRYSGTEPKARIMVEGEPRAAIEASAARLRQVIEEAIGLASP
jgi:phosphoglucosamine mutase